ncbi:hypothetical protein [Deinococcus cellulosilyticus]|nr:hypothetical protein [Deinococcus cellulosilyticus]
MFPSKTQVGEQQRKRMLVLADIYQQTKVANQQVAYEIGIHPPYNLTRNDVLRMLEDMQDTEVDNVDFRFLQAKLTRCGIDELENFVMGNQFARNFIPTVVINHIAGDGYLQQGNGNTMEVHQKMGQPFPEWWIQLQGLLSRHPDEAQKQPVTEAVSTLEELLGMARPKHHLLKAQLQEVVNTSDPGSALHQQLQAFYEAFQVGFPE